MKQVSFSALQRMAKEFDDDENDEQETGSGFATAMDFYLYVVDNHEAVEKEITEGK